MMKRTLACLSLTLLAVLPTTGCGSLLFTQRQHASHSTRLDPNVLILDTAGLFLFIVPGLVAFGIDFYTGAVYLPPDIKRGEGPFIRDVTATVEHSKDKPDS